MENQKEYRKEELEYWVEYQELKLERERERLRNQEINQIRETIRRLKTEMTKKKYWLVDRARLIEAIEALEADNRELTQEQINKKIERMN